MHLKYTKIISYTIVLFLILCCVFSVADSCIDYVNKKDNQEITYTNDFHDIKIQTLKGLNTVTQTLPLKNLDISSLGIYFSKTNTRTRLFINVYDSTTGDKLESWIYNTQKVQEDSYIPFKITDSSKFQNINEITVEICFTESNFKVSDFLWMSAGDVMEGDLDINGVKQTGDLNISVTHKINTKFVSLFVFFIAVIVISVVAVVFYFVLFKKNILSIEHYFIILAAVFGILIAVILPPFSTPDELWHFGKAYAYSNLIRGEGNTSGELGAIVSADRRSALSAASFYPSYKTYCEIWLYSDSSPMKVEERSFYELQGSVVSPLTGTPLLHVVQAFGVLTGRLLNLSLWQIVYLVRFFNLFVFIAAIYFVLKIIPDYAKNLFFSVSVLPMLLELGASCSYDVIIVILCFLFIAYWLKLIEQNLNYTKKDLGILIALLFLLAPCKNLYIIIGILCFSLPIDNFKSKKGYFRFLLELFIPAILIILIFNLNVFIDMLNPSVDIAWSSSNVSRLSVKDIITYPLHIMQLFVNTLEANSLWYLFTAIGSELGWLSIVPAPILIFLYTVVLFLASFSDSYGEKVILLKHKISLALVFLGTVGATLMVFLISTTPANSTVIRGIQGRYFLPVLPLFFLFVRGKWIRINCPLRKIIICSVTLLNAFIILDVAKIVICG